MPNPQDYKIATLNIENNPVRSDPESICPESRICQFLCICEGVFFISHHGFVEPMFSCWIELVDIFDRLVSIYKSEFQEPKTSS